MIVEVKCRSGLGFGDPLESITWPNVMLASTCRAWRLTFPGPLSAIRRGRHRRAKRLAPASQDTPCPGNRVSTASSWSVALLGMEGTLVEVEAAIGAGLPRDRC